MFPHVQREVQREVHRPHVDRRLQRGYPMIVECTPSRPSSLAPHGPINAPRSSSRFARPKAAWTLASVLRRHTAGIVLPFATPCDRMSQLGCWSASSEVGLSEETSLRQSGDSTFVGPSRIIPPGSGDKFCTGGIDGLVRLIVGGDGRSVR